MVLCVNDILYLVNVTLALKELLSSQLRYELEMYASGLSLRPAAVLANKIDIEDSEDKLERLSSVVSDLNMELIPVSGRMGLNLTEMLVRIKQLHDKFQTSHS